MLLNAAPLALSLFGGGQSPYPAEKSLRTLATNAGSEGAALTGYAASGTLPPGGEAVVDAQRKANEAKVRSTFGRLGLAGSTMESQALEEAGSQASGQRYLLAENLLGAGLTAQQIAAGDYKAVLTAEMSRDAQFSNALATFARGLAGGAGNYNANTQPTYSVA
jgi:hypothetical protein